MKARDYSHCTCEPLSYKKTSFQVASENAHPGQGNVPN